VSLNRPRDADDRERLVAPSPGSFDRHFRTVLGHFATGVAIVTARENGEAIGMTVQSFCSLSLDPPLILLCPAKSSTSWPKIEKAGRLCVNLLAEGQADLARQFAQSGSDKYQGVSWSPAPRTGSPILMEALGWIDCEIQDMYPGGDHVVVICRVLDLQALPGRPLVFFQSGFQRIVPEDMTSLGNLRSVVLAVADMDAACHYYGTGLGLSLMLRDGNRWAVFHGGDFNLALAGEDRILDGGVAVNIKVRDVAEALKRAQAAGATKVEDPTRGQHEIRGAFRDPDGHLFYVYSPLES
jgi:3-hydroxy-9,10-secoandrosta-1,3,5(10)-triene-9,17-dione monooxygenase reductase component